MLTLLWFIFQLVEYHSNLLFYQLIMLRHGQGMDLFEFIDRCPDMDEALASYIYRQV